MKASADPLETFGAAAEEEDEPSAKKRKREEAPSSDTQILESCLALLSVDPGHLGGIWKWSVLYEALANGRHVYSELS